jgi:hypothetical protein
VIRTVAGCPFCADGVVAFDDRLEIVFNPDSLNATPCDHLCFFWVSLPGPTSWYWGRFWEREQGLGQFNTKDVLTDMVFALTADDLHSDYVPRVPHIVVGGVGWEREEKEPSTGMFWVYPPADSPQFVEFDTRSTLMTLPR